MDEYARALGRRIRQLREERGLTQAQVAEEIDRLGVQGFYPQTVVKLEAGTRALKFQEGLALAKVLEVSVERLGADWDRSSASLELERALDQMDQASGHYRFNAQRVRKAYDAYAAVMADDGIARSMARHPAYSERLRELVQELAEFDPYMREVWAAMSHGE